MSDSVLAEIIESLNRIESKFDKNYHDIVTRLDSHIKDDDININKVSTQIEKLTDLETAFIKSHDGSIDFHGHRSYHLAKVRINDWVKDVKSKTLLKIIEYFSLGFVIWLFYIIWQAVSQGPKI